MRLKSLFSVLAIFLVFNFKSQNKLLQESYDLYQLGEIVASKKTIERINEADIVAYPLKEKIEFYIDYGKMCVFLKKYGSSLKSLLKAKELDFFDNNKHETLINLSLSLLFESIGSLDLAIKFKKIALPNIKDKINRNFVVSDIAAMYYKLEKSDSALHYFNYQLEYSKKYLDEISIASATNNVGLAYFQNKQYAQALQNFKDVARIVKKEIDIDFYISVQENLGRVYFVLKQYDNAINCFEEVTEYDIKHKRILKNTFYSNMLVSACLTKNRVKDALRKRASLSKFYSAMNNNAKLYFLLLSQDIFLFQKDFKQAKINLLKLQEIQIELAKEKKVEINTSSKILEIYLNFDAKNKLSFEKKKRASYEKMIKFEKRESNFFKLFSFSIIVLLIIFFFVLYQIFTNKRKKALLEKEFLELQEQKLILKVNFQEKNLTEYAIDNFKKDELTKEIISKLKNISSLSEEDVTEQVKVILNEINTRQSFHKRAIELETNSESLVLNFKSKLFELHPTLSKGEVELCTLIKLKFSNKEIASFRGITEESVKMGKNRLKKKLNLSAKQILGNYLAEIN